MTKTPEPYRQEPEDLDLLAQELAKEIASGADLTLFFDNDGTVCPFVEDPKDVTIDPSCYQALVRLKHLPGVTVFSLTGRDVREARDLMLTPELEVRDFREALLSEAGRKTLHFAIIGSHGVECLAPDGGDGSSGAVTRHAFSEAEQAFIDGFQAKAREFKARHPSLTVEIKHGAVGVNVATLDGMNDEEKGAVLDAALETIGQIVDSDSAPRTLDGGKIFALRREGTNEFEVRPVIYGKDFGMRAFGILRPERRTLFLCDSLGPEGTDRPAAVLVNSLEKGMVFMVLNGRNAPPEPDDAHAPRAVFKSPADLGGFLVKVAKTAESMLGPQPNRKPSASPAPGAEP